MLHKTYLSTSETSNKNTASERCEKTINIEREIKIIFVRKCGRKLKISFSSNTLDLHKQKLGLFLTPSAFVEHRKALNINSDLDFLKNELKIKRCLACFVWASLFALCSLFLFLVPDENEREKKSFKIVQRHSRHSLKRGKNCIICKTK